MDNNIDITLLGFQALFWAISVYRLWGKNRYYSIFCMVLYLYLLPTEITYRFFPSFYDFYWGPDIWYEFYWFINFSLIVLLIVLNRWSKVRGVYNVISYKKKTQSRRLIIIFIFTFSLLATYLLATNAASITYSSVVANGAEGNEDIKLLFIDQIFKWLPTFVIFPLVAMAEKKWYSTLFIIFNIVLFMLYNILSGSRSDILAVTLGLVLLWMYGRKLKIKQIVTLVCIAAAFLFLAGQVYILRGGSNDGTLAETLLKQDYTAPAYNIVGVIGKNIVDPLMVIESQILKTFPLIGGEWMYMTIGDKIFPGSQISASQSWGFHPFVEGYLFVGFLGFLYNGFVIGLGLSVWNRFMSTNDINFNRFMFAVMGCIFFALVREQTIYFFRYIYFSFLPSAFLYSRLCNIDINFIGFLRKPSQRIVS